MYLMVEFRCVKCDDKEYGIVYYEKVFALELFIVSKVEGRGNIKKNYCCSCCDELFGCGIAADSCQQQLFMYTQIKSYSYNKITKTDHSCNAVLGSRIQ